MPAIIFGMSSSGISPIAAFITKMTDSTNVDTVADSKHFTTFAIALLHRLAGSVPELLAERRHVRLKTTFARLARKVTGRLRDLSGDPNRQGQ
jgi:hypothetical protein